MLTHS